MACKAAALGLLGALAVGAFATPALAQNGFSFTDAGKSAVNYSQAVVAPRKACRELAGLAAIGSSGLTVVSAEEVRASANAPAFCRVLGVVEPEVQIEIALPSAWNRRVYMRGNGGFAGESLEAPPRIADRNRALQHGFVAAQTNTGHDAAAQPLATFAQGSMQKMLDYAFRAIHVTAQAAKQMAAVYYDRPVAFSYFDGCSTGGRQGLMSAQRFPGDFDGIVVGAPVLNFTDTMMWNIWNAKALAAAPVPIEKMAIAADRVYAKCDALDGARDGLIEDPRQCPFDVAKDLPACAGGSDGADCFTPAQIEALGKIYGGVVSQGKPYFPGQPVGAEAKGRPFFGAGERESGWADWIIPSGPRPGVPATPQAVGGKSRQLAYGETFLQHMAFLPRSNPGYEWTRFDLDKDIPAPGAPIRRMLDATNPDLSEFRDRGGRILMYFGWADTALNPRMGIDYYEAVKAKLGAKETEAFYRLFMVPGMFHCRGGLGPDRFDPLTPLIDWVEGGKAPTRLLAEQREGAGPGNPGTLARTRPLCPYPQVARHSGSGSLDDAASFECSLPR